MALHIPSLARMRRTGDNNNADGTHGHYHKTQTGFPSEIVEVL